MINAIKQLEETKEKLYSTTEVANMLHLTNVTIMKYVKQGKLKAIRISERKVYITESSLNEYLNNIAIR